MKEPNNEGIARHIGPESCAENCKVISEALTGENAGQVLSCEIKWSRGPTLLSEAEGNIMGDVKCLSHKIRRSRRP